MTINLNLILPRGHMKLKLSSTQKHDKWSRWPKIKHNMWYDICMLPTAGQAKHCMHIQNLFDTIRLEQKCWHFPMHFLETFFFIKSRFHLRLFLRVKLTVSLGKQSILDTAVAYVPLTFYQLIWLASQCFFLRWMPAYNTVLYWTMSKWRERARVYQPFWG